MQEIESQALFLCSSIELIFGKTQIQDIHYYLVKFNGEPLHKARWIPTLEVYKKSQTNLFFFNQNMVRKFRNNFPYINKEILYDALSNHSYLEGSQLQRFVNQLEYHFLQQLKKKQDLSLSKIHLLNEYLPSQQKPVANFETKRQSLLIDYSSKTVEGFSKYLKREIQSVIGRIVIRNKYLYLIKLKKERLINSRWVFFEHEYISKNKIDLKEPIYQFNKLCQPITGLIFDEEYLAQFFHQDSGKSLTKKQAILRKKHLKLNKLENQKIQSSCKIENGASEMSDDLQSFIDKKNQQLEEFIANLQFQEIQKIVGKARVGKKMFYLIKYARLNDYKTFKWKLFWNKEIQIKKRRLRDKFNQCHTQQILPFIDSNYIAHKKYFLDLLSQSNKIVQKVVAKKVSSQDVFYLIKWKNRPISNAQWVRRKDIQWNFSQFIEFNRKFDYDLKKNCSSRQYLDRQKILICLYKEKKASIPTENLQKLDFNQQKLYQETKEIMKIFQEQIVQIKSTFQSSASSEFQYYSDYFDSEQFQKINLKKIQIQPKIQKNQQINKFQQVDSKSGYNSKNEPKKQYNGLQFFLNDQHFQFLQQIKSPHENPRSSKIRRNTAQAVLGKTQIKDVHYYLVKLFDQKINEATWMTTFEAYQKGGSLLSIFNIKKTKYFKSKNYFPFIDQKQILNQLSKIKKLNQTDLKRKADIMKYHFLQMFSKKSEQPLGKVDLISSNRKEELKRYLRFQKIKYSDFKNEIENNICQNRHQSEQKMLNSEDLVDFSSLKINGFAKWLKENIANVLGRIMIKKDYFYLIKMKNDKVVNSRWFYFPQGYLSLHKFYLWTCLEFNYICQDEQTAIFDCEYLLRQGKSMFQNKHPNIQISKDLKLLSQVNQNKQINNFSLSAFINAKLIQLDNIISTFQNIKMEKIIGKASIGSRIVYLIKQEGKDHYKTFRWQLMNKDKKLITQTRLLNQFHKIYQDCELPFIVPEFLQYKNYFMQNLKMRTDKIIQRFVGKKVCHKGTFYLIKWQNQPISQLEWARKIDINIEFNDRQAIKFNHQFEKKTFEYLDRQRILISLFQEKIFNSQNSKLKQEILTEENLYREVDILYNQFKNQIAEIKSTFDPSLKFKTMLNHQASFFKNHQIKVEISSSQFIKIQNDTQILQNIQNPQKVVQTLQQNILFKELQFNNDDKKKKCTKDKTNLSKAKKKKENLKKSEKRRHMFDLQNFSSVNQAKNEDKILYFSSDDQVTTEQNELLLNYQNFL